MDDADHAADARASAAARNAPRELRPCGVCHWCGEPLRQHNQVFCDSVCAADHADNIRRNGS
jgi:hypothetical protein